MQHNQSNGDIKITIDDIKTIIAKAGKSKDRIILDLKAFCENMQQNNDVYLNDQQLFGLCALLLVNHKSSKKPETQNVVAQLENKIGKNNMDVFRLLHNHSKYNQLYFKLVLNFGIKDISAFAQYLIISSRLNSDCIELLNNLGFLSERVFAWLLEQKEMTDENDVFYDSTRARKLNNRCQERITRELSTALSNFSETNNEHPELILFDKIFFTHIHQMPYHEDLLEILFDEHPYLNKARLAYGNIISQYMKSWLPLSYASVGGKSARDINRLFIELQERGLLSRDLLNFLNENCEFIHWIDNLFRLLKQDSLHFSTEFQSRMVSLLRTIYMRPDFTHPRMEEWANTLIKIEMFDTSSNNQSLPDYIKAKLIAYWQTALRETNVDKVISFFSKYQNYLNDICEHLPNKFNADSVLYSLYLLANNDLLSNRSVAILLTSNSALSIAKLLILLKNENLLTDENERIVATLPGSHQSLIENFERANVKTDELKFILRVLDRTEIVEKTLMLAKVNEELSPQIPKDLLMMIAGMVSDYHKMPDAQAIARSIIRKDTVPTGSLGFFAKQESGDDEKGASQIPKKDNNNN